MHIYIDNFMVGRQVEMQQIINMLLQNINPVVGPPVLPIVGSGRVGKKTWVSRVGKKTWVMHICNDNRVRTSFSSTLHLKGDNFQIDSYKFMDEKTLVVIEFISDVT